METHVCTQLCTQHVSICCQNIIIMEINLNNNLRCINPWMVHECQTPINFVFA